MKPRPEAVIHAKLIPHEPKTRYARVHVVCINNTRRGAIEDGQ